MKRCRFEWLIENVKGVSITAAAFGVASLCAVLVWINLPRHDPKPTPPDEPAGPRAIAEADVPKLCGWAGEEIAREENARLKGQFRPFVMRTKAESSTARRTSRDDKRVVLWDAMKLANGGQHYPTYRQEVGDCVSMGASNAVAYLLAVQIVVSGANQKLEVPFQPWIYGTSRVQIGGGRISGDGSVGAWAAAALVKYGALSAKAPDCPPYSGSVARSWGRRPGPPEKFFPLALPNIVKTAAKLESVADLKTAITNGYPATVASNRGFQMNGQVRDGKLWGIPSGSWAHQMCFIGYDPKPEPCYYILNSWGADAHGTPPDDAPPGGFWVKESVAASMIAADDSFALSHLDGFEAQDVNLDVLKLRQARRAASARPRRRRRRERKESVRCVDALSV